jgi:hypothetical protein
MDLTLGPDFMEPSRPVHYVGYVVKQAP